MEEKCVKKRRKSKTNGKYHLIFSKKSCTIEYGQVYTPNETERNGLYMKNDKTQPFNLKEEREKEVRAILTDVYEALKEKGYNPINQIVGYILSEDPTYITNHNNARSIIRKIDRDELMNMLVRYYLDV